MLAQAGNEKNALLVLDTGGTPQGAAQAAAAARKKRASLIIGPLLSAEVPAVLAASGGQIPVVSFSNDANLRESGAFVFGITARQIVRAVLQYAADRGIRRVAVDSATDNWTMQVRDAAMVEGPAIGLIIGEGPGAAFASSEDGLPDAMLMSDPARLTTMNPQLAAQGIQPLAALSEVDFAPDMVRRLEGTWLAAPDPADFAKFAQLFEQRMGTRPGIIAALAFDAASMVAKMRMGGGLDRSAILAATGFIGVCGHVRFRENGSAARSLAIMELVNGGIRKVAEPQAV